MRYDIHVFLNFDFAVTTLNNTSWNLFFITDNCKRILFLISVDHSRFCPKFKGRVVANDGRQAFLLSTHNSETIDLYCIKLDVPGF